MRRTALTFRIGAMHIHARLMHIRLMYAALLWLAGWAGLGCTRPNPAVCCTSPADCASIGAMGETERACSDGFACIDHECTTPEAPPDAPPAPPCTEDSHCTGSLTHCSPANVCVECLQSSHCSGFEPVCDATQMCRACSKDSECESSACEVSTGACLADSEVLYVAPAGASASSCTRAQTCTMTRAIALAAPGRSTVKMSPGTYDASLDVNGKDLSVHGEGATLTAIGGDSVFDIQAGARVRLRDLAIVNLGGDGAVYCYDADADLDMTGVSVTSDGGALVIQGCTGRVVGSRLVSTSASVPNVFAASGNFSIERTTIDGGSGVLAEGAATLVRVNNSQFVNQVGSNGPFSGSNLFGGGAGSVFVSFSTVIGSVVKCSGGTPRCAGGTGIGSCMDNSIVYVPALGSADDAVQGPCTATYSLITPQTSLLAGGNNVFSVLPMFKNATSGDYHLKATSPAVDAADPAATNAVDYDGVARPQGTRRDVGAFEYK